MKPLFVLILWLIVSITAGPVASVSFIVALIVALLTFALLGRIERNRALKERQRILDAQRDAGLDRNASSNWNQWGR